MRRLLSATGARLQDIADYIDSFYNSERHHSHLGGVSPDNFEAAVKRLPKRRVHYILGTPNNRRYASNLRNASTVSSERPVRLSTSSTSSASELASTAAAFSERLVRP